MEKAEIVFIAKVLFGFILIAGMAVLAYLKRARIVKVLQSLRQRLTSRPSPTAVVSQRNTLNRAARWLWQRKSVVLSALLFVAIWLSLPSVWAIAASIGVMVIYGAMFWLAWNRLAPQNKFFTFVNEGTAKVVVRGGKVIKVLLQLSGYTLDKNGYIVKGDEWYLFGGLRWVGFYPLDDIYIYKFQWTGVDHDGTIRPHDAETLDYVLVKRDTYYFAEDGLEDSEQFPVKVGVLLTMRVVNPYKALFAIQNWLETIINRFKPMVRDKVAGKAYRDLIREKGSMGGDLFNDSQALRDEFAKQYGINVEAVEVHSIDPMSEDQRKATLRKWTAERDAEAMAIDANARADLLKKLADATANLTTNGAVVMAVQALLPQLRDVIVAWRGGGLSAEDIVDKVIQTLAAKQGGQGSQGQSQS